MEKKRLLENGLEGFFKASSMLSAAAIIGIIIFLVYFSLPVLDPDGLRELFSWKYQPLNNSFSIVPMIAGSLLLSISALIFAFPAAIAICCFANGLGPDCLARLLLILIHFMTSIPTVVYAFVSAAVMVPFIRNFFNYGSGYSLLAASLTLSILILPTIVLLIEAWWQGIIQQLHLTCASLGLTEPQKLLRIVIPVSKRGLVTAGILGFGRAIGDTMIALMIAGNAPQIPGSILDPIRTLTAHIAFGLEADTESIAYHSVFACGLILLLITGTINITVRKLSAAGQKGVGE